LPSKFENLEKSVKLPPMALKSETFKLQFAVKIRKFEKFIKKSVKSTPIALQFAAKIRKFENPKIHQKSVKLPPMALP
jgi:hypothetical protein